MRLTRAVRRDRRVRPAVAPSAPQVEARLAEVGHPATLARVAAFRDRGLRQRALTLPVIVAFVLSLLWRQLGSVAEAARVLTTEGVLWADASAVSLPAVSRRLRRLPAAPDAAALAWALAQFAAVLALDGSTPGALLRKGGLLRAAEQAPLAGRMAALLDVVTRLPRRVWYEAAPPGARPALLLFDLGFRHDTCFDTLTGAGVRFLTRVASTAVYRVERALHAAADRLLGLAYPWTGTAPARPHHALCLSASGTTERHIREEARWQSNRRSRARRQASGGMQDSSGSGSRRSCRVPGRRSPAWRSPSPPSWSSTRPPPR